VPYWSAKIDPLVVSHETDNGKVEKLKRYGGRREGRREGGRDNRVTLKFWICYVLKLL
jgi:hypothetical protein